MLGDALVVFGGDVRLAGGRAAVARAVALGLDRRQRRLVGDGRVVDRQGGGKYALAGDAVGGRLARV